MMKKSAFAGLAAAAILSIAGAGVAQAADPDGSVTDNLGKHAPGAVDMPADPAIRTDANACGNFGQYGGDFDTSLGGGWSFLAARSGPCRAASGNDGWGTGSRFHVSKEANGEFICRSRTQGIGSDVWFKTSKGWSWSGGTSDARWHAGCN